MERRHAPDDSLCYVHALHSSSMGNHAIAESRVPLQRSRNEFAKSIWCTKSKLNRFRLDATVQLLA